MLAEFKLPLLKEHDKFLCNCFLAKILSNRNFLCLNAIKYYFNITKNKAFNNGILNRCISFFMDLCNKIDSQSHFNIYCYDFKALITSILFDYEFGLELKKI